MPPKKTAPKSKSNKLSKSPDPEPSTEPAVPHSDVTLERLWNATAAAFLERLEDKSNPPRASMMDAITRWLSSNGAVLENMKRSSGPAGIRQGNQFNALSSRFDRLTDAMKDIDQSETNDSGDNADAQ